MKRCENNQTCQCPKGYCMDAAHERRGWSIICNEADYEPDCDRPRHEPAPAAYDREAITPVTATLESFGRPKHDPVFRPHHYARWAIEPNTFIMANDLPYWMGNVIKYIMRYDAKDGLQDLRKAARYLEMQIENMERKANGTVADCVGKPL